MNILEALARALNDLPSVYPFTGKRPMAMPPDYNRLTPPPMRTLPPSQNETVHDHMREMMERMRERNLRQLKMLMWLCILQGVLAAVNVVIILTQKAPAPVTAEMPEKGP